jgi:hypothetical protein
MQNTKARNLWYAVLAVQAIGLLNLLIAVVLGLSKTDSIPSVGFFLVAWGVPIAIVFLYGVVLWAVYRMERWVSVWMWIAVAFAILMFDVIAIAVTVFVVLAYRHVLKVAQGVAPVAPASPPPPPPPAKV